MIIIGGYAIPNSFNNIFTENNSSFWEWILCIDDEIPKITCIPDYKAIAKFKLTTFYLGDTTVEDRTLIGAFTADTGTTLYLNNTTLLRQSLTGEDIIEQFLIGGGSPSTYYIKGVELKNGLPVIKSYDTWLYSGQVNHEFSKCQEIIIKSDRYHQVVSIDEINDVLCSGKREIQYKTTSTNTSNYRKT